MANARDSATRYKTSWGQHEPAPDGPHFGPMNLAIRAGIGKGQIGATAGHDFRGAIDDISR